MHKLAFSYRFETIWNVYFRNMYDTLDEILYRTIQRCQIEKKLKKRNTFLLYSYFFLYTQILTNFTQIELTFLLFSSDIIKLIYWYLIMIRIRPIF